MWCMKSAHDKNVIQENQKERQIAGKNHAGVSTYWNPQGVTHSLAKK